MKKLSTHSLLSMSIVLPCRTEQDKAVELMNSNAGVLDQTKALLDLKARFRKEIAYRLLCGTTRHPYSLGARWVNVSLGELFVERNETQRADLPLLSITADRGVIRRSEVDRKDSSSENKTAYKRITPGDIGYNTMRMWQGVSALSEQEGIISPAYTVCTPTNHVDGRFAAHLFKHPSMINLFFRHSQGLVDDTLNLKFSHFAKIRVTIPEIDEQRHIAHILDSLNDELHALRKYHALLHVKAELLRERLTGAALIIAGDRVG
jgi:type I restriction enzyme S subunit